MSLEFDSGCLMHLAQVWVLDHLLWVLPDKMYVL